MKKVLLQFHATPEELILFLEGLRQEISFSTGFMKSNPFEVKLFYKSDAVDFRKMIEADKGCRVILSISETLCSAESANRFFDSNQDCLVLDVGQHSFSVLAESALSGFVEDTLALGFASNVVARLKKITKAGVIAVNPNNGAEVNIKNHRYTDGAKILYENGCRISPIAGKAYLKIIWASSLVGKRDH